MASSLGSSADLTRLAHCSGANLAFASDDLVASSRGCGGGGDGGTCWVRAALVCLSGETESCSALIGVELEGVRLIRRDIGFWDGTVGAGGAGVDTRGTVFEWVGRAWP